MKVGDMLWYVPSYRRNGGTYVKVLKVGRLYVTLSNHRRADKVSLRTEDGVCYLSKNEYDLEVAFRVALSDFKNKVFHLRVDNTDLKCLLAANEALDSFGKVSNQLPGD
jgi:hypothetical protein